VSPVLVSMSFNLLDRVLGLWKVLQKKSFLAQKLINFHF
jgi:hypothetical protein